MRVQKISIRNVLGIESLDIMPGTVTVIEGANGTGKTSITEALKAITGGADATLVRDGTVAGEVVLVLEDGREIRRRVSAKASPLQVKDAVGSKMKAPGAAVGELIDSLSVNPIAFLTAPEKQRAAWLLEAMPLSVTLEDLSACGVVPLSGDADGHALEALERVSRRLYDARTGINSLAKGKRATVAQLIGTLPTGGRPTSELAEKRARLEAIDAQLVAAKTEDHGQTAGWIEEARVKYEQEIRAHEAEINRLRIDSANRLAELKQSYQDRGRDRENKAQAERERLLMSIAALEQEEQEQVRAEQTRHLVAKMADEAAASEADSLKLTNTLGALGALKKRLVEQLPIRGLEIRDGAVFADGLPFERLNRARQVQIALQVAKLRAGEVPLVVVDNLECLDPDTFAAFEAAAQKSGMQFIVTRVSSGP
ncbi:MAG TPA: AAA family ATPase, partial [Polyangiaceae bacterium]|nr:AAA family ATPase [Polyangiaceae bacterium]